MGLFDKSKTSTAIDRLLEEKLYEQVGQELKAGKKREGIWIKAMAKTGGDLNKAEALYIELRVQAIQDEASLATAQQKLKEELEEGKRGARKEEELDRQKKLSQKKYREDGCINRLKGLGYKVVLFPNPAIAYEVIDRVSNTDTSQSFDTLDELCKFSHSAPDLNSKKAIENIPYSYIFVFTLVCVIVVVASSWK